MLGLVSILMKTFIPRPSDWRESEICWEEESERGETTFTLENELVMAVKPSQPSTDRSKRWKKDSGIIFFNILPFLS